MWIRHNENPEKRNVGDCTVRAISTVTGMGWKYTYLMLLMEGFSCFDMPSANAVWGNALRHLGYIRRALPDICPECYTVREFCRDFPSGRFVLALPTHVVAVIDGDYYDTWDSGDESPIYYWFKEDER